MECNPNAKKCTCSFTSCSRWGNCCKCVSYHRNKNELPGCYFSKDIEITAARSYSAFIADKGL